MRKKVIAGNWKMNHNPAETKEFFDTFKEMVKDSEHEIILCVP